MLKKVNDLIGKLSMVKRFSDTKLINPESVLEHTACVSILSMCIANKLIEQGEEIDMAILYENAMLHDIEESITGDIINPTKYANEEIRSALLKYEIRCARAIFIDLPRPEAMFNRWRTAKAGKEGFIVRLADKLSIVYKMNQEVIQFSNKHFSANMSPSIISDLMDMKDTNLIDNKEVVDEIIHEGANLCKKILSHT